MFVRCVVVKGNRSPTGPGGRKRADLFAVQDHETSISSRLDTRVPPFAQSSGFASAPVNDHFCPSLPPVPVPLILRDNKGS
jgi:hypothetical protein